MPSRWALISDKRRSSCSPPLIAELSGALTDELWLRDGPSNRTQCLTSVECLAIAHEPLTARVYEEYYDE